jgi:ATP-dependent Lon protease
VLVYQWVNLLQQTLQKWSDLMKSSLWSERSIKNKMLELARVINTACNDEFLELDIAFTVKTELDETVKYSYLEMYTFLRAALRYRRNTAEYAEYRNNKNKVKELEGFIESNKSTKEKLTEAKAELEKLKTSF